MGRIIFGYIFRELWSPFLISLFSLTSLLLTIRMIPLSGLLLKERAGVSEFFQVFQSLYPYFLVFCLPMSALVASLVAFLRLSQDSELLAFEALGVSFYELLAPVTTFALIVFSLTMLVTVYVLPQSKANFRQFMRHLLSQKIARGLPEKTFASEIPGLTIYAGQTHGGGLRLREVFLYDGRKKDPESLILAQSGRIDPKGPTLILKDGVIHRFYQKQDKGEIIRFGTMTIKLTLGAPPGTAKRRGEMGLLELRERAKDFPPGSKRRLKLESEFHKRLAFPFASIIFSILGAALAAQIKGSGRSAGVSLAVILFLLYYGALAGATGLAETGRIPPVLSLWLPNIFFGLLSGGLVLLSGQSLKITLGRKKP
ncbi:YjgP/YjgQ family permease [Thermosulfuriphilus ammonigenes]|uniref:YjgP/YjgQ family permease n=1 Tax=Thermosulfuriphilus ammonigenes TaxID=1936021 RepID=A0A6G7PTM3_9BACT|nr:LptF/LptG family permease [Thermosulfuriphilus ammonigenes]MBA2848842.1 lipopolysaccharide export system permease protein [Thermosulfuriphilus ammonigenes]QIJ71035.1 YjgP/YjgQ family permease [Thermosulfuriphilus ammonigenes]